MEAKRRFTAFGLLSRVSNRDSPEFLQSLVTQIETGTVDEALLQTLADLTLEQRKRLGGILQELHKTKYAD